MYIIILLQNEIKHSLSTVIMDTQPFVSIKFLFFKLNVTLALALIPCLVNFKVGLVMFFQTPYSS